ncbi:zinc finger and BTB domain-containing protein 41 isoform X2 [Drosophila biarmipes]|uniref:zinc finger and BTB domain-containing protein 41 isoform X2 n=1 Tax=Drosophila biarmipes TaxID=125945 RepID=UPI0007E88F0F|nr:zinc finger and BTB domain-containing protein 41 isoform X2 [Drosophila biarmipes]
MTPQLLDGHHYVESARVYMKRDSSILIKCCLCNADTFAGGKWEDFTRHLLQGHGELHQSDPDMDEIQDEVQIELSNLLEAGIGQETQLAEEQEEEVFTDVEFLDEEEETGDPISSSEKEQDQEEHEGSIHQVYILNKPNKPFYSLQRTSPEIIQYFIELLRRHQHLWSSHHGINKKIRLESSKKVAQALSHRFGFHLEAKVVNASVRFLQLWFERHLLRFMPTSHISVTICEECDRRCLNERQLRLHKFRVHGGPNPNTCHVCHQGFPLASKLEQHKARYHFKPLEWQCSQCDYNAPSKWDFQQHQAMHAGQRNYTCEVCGHTCKTSSALAVHRRTHDQPRLPCPQCNRRFRENYTLKCHIRKIHEGDSAWRFFCSICSRRFQAKEMLKLHELVHSQREEKESEDTEDPEELNTTFN